MTGWTPNDIVRWAIANCGLDDLDASRILGDIEDVVKVEREACAALCEEFARRPRYVDGSRQGLVDAAVAIRARGN